MESFDNQIVEEYGLDSALIESCYEEAEEGLKNGEVPVGCVFVWKNKLQQHTIIARAHNRTNKFRSALKHAEMECIQQVIDRFDKDYMKIFEETVVLLTLEPCIMCCRILRKLNVKAVLFGALNDRFGGAGSVYAVHNDNRIKCKNLLCIPALDSSRSISLLQQFYDQTNLNVLKNKC